MRKYVKQKLSIHFWINVVQDFHLSKKGTLVISAEQGLVKVPRSAEMKIALTF